MGNPTPWRERPKCPICGHPMRRLEKSGSFYCAGDGCGVESVRITMKSDLAWGKAAPNAPVV